MIVGEEVRDGVAVYTVAKDYSDEYVAARVGKFCKSKHCAQILDHDADVYTTEGKLLLRFRKGVLPKNHLDAAFDNLIVFAKRKTSTRGATSGTEAGNRNPGVNLPIMSNILGYFDKWTIKQKEMFKTLGIKPPFDVRVTSFTTSFPEKWAAVVPLVQDIDRMYRKLAPAHYRKQRALADQTAYRVPGTAFTTVTTNVNLQTAYHTDSGDFPEGFGNLVVIERGEYDGGETIFPQYKIGVNVRTGDFLAMDVHQVHGNTRFRPRTKDAVRMSLVCYLRQDVYEKSRGTTEAHVRKNLATMARIQEQYREVIRARKAAAAQ